MWVITTDERHAIYNLAAFDVVVAVEAPDRGSWSVLAQDRAGQHGVLLASTDTQRQAETIVEHIANRLGALDLGAD
jgi:hypothetical protein